MTQHNYEAFLKQTWQRFFDANGERYYDGKEINDLAPESLCFWLSRLQCWLEITMSELTDATKSNFLWSTTGYPVVLASGIPHANSLSVFCADGTDGGGGEGWWDECFWALNKQDQLCICSNNDLPSRQFSREDGDTWEAMKLLRDIKKALS